MFAGRQQEQGGAATPEVRAALLKLHGSFPIAYSVAFQPELSHFGDERGFLSYKMVGRTAFVLGDPIAAPSDRAAILDRFCEMQRDVAFYQVSRDTAAHLNARGFFVNAFGSESVVDLQGFSLKGPQRRSFRTAANRFTSSGHRVVERSLRDFNAADLTAVAEGWRKGKATKRRELSFLVRPIVLEDEPAVRKFILVDREEKPVALAFFDPVYANGEVTGYLSATRRWLPGTDPLAGYFLMKTAIETFQAEGIAHLHLGLSPFHRIEDREFNKNWVTRRAFRFFYTNSLTNRFFYPAKSLSQHKEIYGGSERLVYCAFNRLPALARHLKLLRACRIV